MKSPIILPWQQSDRLQRYTAWGSWAIIAYSILVVFHVPLPWQGMVTLLALWVPACFLVMIRQFRQQKRDAQRMKRMADAMRRGELFDTLSAEDQEEINIVAAKMRLRQKDQ